MMSWYARTRLMPWGALRHLDEMPAREQAIRDEEAAGRISRQKASRKLANERGWATRCRRVIATSLPISN